MKVDSKSLTKLYYSIGEVADMFDVSTSLIRYWESEFKHLSPQKNRRGDRRYTKKDIADIELIYSYVKEKGYTLDGAAKAIKEHKSKRFTKSDLIKRLEKIKQELEVMKNELD